MSKITNTAEAQLERILYILPAAARGRRVSIDVIARALDVPPATVLRDLEDATARAFYHPAGAIEAFSITTDGRTVQVHSPDEFRRPVRLNDKEGLAVGLGLRMMAADEDAARRSEILELAARLEAALVVTDRGVPDIAMARSLSGAAEDEVEYEELSLAFDDDGFRGVIADAVEQQRICTIWYLKPGETGPARRLIAPYRLVYASGMWYVAAYDVERDGLRYFRMDRVLDASLTHEQSPPAPEGLVAMLAKGVPYSATEEVEVTVRYSPRVARWVTERLPLARVEHDGSARLQHRVADPRWLARHIMQYGGDAHVEAPSEAREWVRQAALAVSPE
jgi:predicted DNA-binding transcriptional regulator YafY